MKQNTKSNIMLVIFAIILMFIGIVGMLMLIQHDDKKDNITIVHSDSIELKELTEQCDLLVYNSNYNACLLYLMYSEDILLKPYDKLTGQSLVYFGHAVKHGESFPDPNYRKAFDLLQVDFCKCIDEAVRLGFDENNNKQLAVAVMTYNMKPKSVQEIIKDSLLSNIHKYIWYYKTKDSTIIKCTSKNLENNRAFEKALYFQDGMIDFNIYLP